MAQKYVKGVEAHLKRLRAIRDIESPVIQSLLDSGEMVRVEVLESLRRGTIRGAGHVPSAPGEPPNADSGQLELGVSVRLRATEKRVEVVSEAPYSAAQEFGTRDLPARPFMRPALRKHRSRVVLGIVNTIKQLSIRVYKNG